MKEKVIADPTVAGWEYDSASGYWMWSAEGGSIQDGDIEGQITTWSGAEWTPEGAVVVDASGNATFSGRADVKKNAGTAGDALDGSQSMIIQNLDDGPASIKLVGGSTGNGPGQICYGNSAGGSSFTVKDRNGNTPRLTIDTSGETTFTGTVNANLYRGGFGALTTGGVEDWDDESNCVNGYGRVMLKGNSANGPDGSTDYFHVLNVEYSRGTTSNRTQIAIPYRADKSSMWMRSRYSGTWGAWKEIGGGGLPDGDFTHNGKITATDFIATSDERLKDNITPMPVGLIDGIKPVQWDWKDGSGKSAGVVAQQLQAIGLDDYVVEGDDGQLGVNYQALTAILLAEVISLKAEVEALK
jgi:hypothetical protein